MRRNIALTLVAVLIAAVMLPLLATSEASADTWAGVAAEGIVGDYNTPQAQAACSAVYNGLLYVGTRSVSGCEVWSYDGATWTSIAGSRVRRRRQPGGHGYGRLWPEPLCGHLQAVRRPPLRSHSAWCSGHCCFPAPAP